KTVGHDVIQMICPRGGISRSPGPASRGSDQVNQPGTKQRSKQEQTAVGQVENVFVHPEDGIAGALDPRSDRKAGKRAAPHLMGCDAAAPESLRNRGPRVPVVNTALGIADS